MITPDTSTFHHKGSIDNIMDGAVDYILVQERVAGENKSPQTCQGVEREELISVLPNLKCG